jgi:hypothetical protein
MNIDLIYKSNSFNFDLRKDISVKYLEDMASKLISKDKSYFDLFYNNNNLSEYSNSLLKDVTQNEGTIPIVISPKINQSRTNVQQILPKIKLTKYIKKTSKENIIKNNILILNNNENFHPLSGNSTKNMLKNKLNINAQKKKQKEKKYHIKNEVFEEIYDNKESELLILMTTLSQKIKEYDDILYQKYKNDSKNRDLLLFEKNIIDFKNRQLQYIKKLLNYFEEKFELEEFFRELKKSCSNLKDGFRRNKKDDQSKIYSITQVNENETPNRNNELPLINYKENKPVKTLYLSENKIKKNNRNESEKEQINNKTILKSEKKINKNILDRNITNNLYQNIEVQDINIYKTLDEKKPQKNKTYLKKRSIGTTKDNTNQSESSTFSKMQEKQNYILNLKNPKIMKNENQNENSINKNNNDKNEINEENIENIENKINDKSKNNLNNDFDNHKNNINIKTNINNDKKDKGDENDDKLNRLNSLPKNKRRLSIESINYDNNKLSCLLEDINESNNNDNDSDSDSDSDSNSNSSYSGSNKESNSNKSKNRKMEDIEVQQSGKTVKSLVNKKKKRMNYSNIKNSKIGYMMKSKQRKANQREKKLGKNEYDFLI